MVNSFILTWQGKTSELVRKTLLQSIFFSKWLKSNQENYKIGIPYNLQLLWCYGRLLCTVGHILPPAWALTSIYVADWVHPECDQPSWAADHFFSPPSSLPTGPKCPCAICSGGHAVNTQLLWDFIDWMEASSIVCCGKFMCYVLNALKSYASHLKLP